MKTGQIAYFYYDTIIPCQKGKVKEVMNNGVILIAMKSLGWMKEVMKPEQV